MIPKIIHYCWFGRNPKPELYYKCRKSWEKKCPDYQIIEWNEANFDISACPLYVRQAYEAKKWAFVTDYVRLKVVYDHGGIYLDTDVELRKNLDSLLGYDAYFGFEHGNHIATGLGFGAVKGLPLLKELMEDYRDIPFILEDGKFDCIPCPERNTKVFLRKGLRIDNSKQIIEGNVLILPPHYLNPINFETQKKTIKRETISIHWYSSSWLSKEEEERVRRDRQRRLQLQREAKIHRLIHLPNEMCMRIVGEEKYEKLKSLLKR